MNGSLAPTGTRSLKLRALLYLYSNRNILGCALAMAGPLLLFSGVIRGGWLLITLGLYGIGALLAGSQPEVERRIEDSLSADDVLAALDTLIRQVSPQLNADMQSHLASIRGSARDVLPRLAGQGGGDLYTVRETILRYLPETLANYVALPPAFRTTHPVKDGKTARQLLSEQLRMLDEQMQDVVANVAKGDAQALVANGQFLEAKFRQPDFLLGR